MVKKIHLLIVMFINMMLAALLKCKGGNPGYYLCRYAKVVIAVIILGVANSNFVPRTSYIRKKSRLSTLAQLQNNCQTPVKETVLHKYGKVVDTKSILRKCDAEVANNNLESYISP